MRLEGGAAAGKERDLNQNYEKMNDRSNKQWKRGDRWKKQKTIIAVAYQTGRSSLVPCRLKVMRIESDSKQRHDLVLPHP